MGGDELLQLADELRVAAERELGVDPPLDRGEPDLLEPLDRGPRERLVREIGERRAAPEPERLAQQLRGLLPASPRSSLRGTLATGARNDAGRAAPGRSEGCSRARGSRSPARRESRRSSETWRCTCVTAVTGAAPW